MSYKLTHPDSDLEIEVDSDRVPMYLTQGWKTKPSVKDPELPPELAGAPATITESE